MTVHGNVIYKSQMWKTSQMSLRGWMDKKTNKQKQTNKKKLVHPYSGILPNNEKEHTQLGWISWVLYAEWQYPVLKCYILSGSIYKEFPKWQN